jgi:ubiquitin carboxyl-terminal hydrolase 5/13
MDTVQALLESSASLVRVPTASDAVYKNECVYSFHTPFHEGGLWVSLSSWIGTAPVWAGTSDALFLRIVQERRLKETNDESMGTVPTEDPSSTSTSTSSTDSATATNAPMKVAIGVPGGFPLDRYETISTYSILVVDNSTKDPSTGAPVIVAEVPYTSEDRHTFPVLVAQAVEAILHHAGTTLQQDVQAWALDQDDIPVSKYAADLPFIDNGVTISPDPTAWQCQKYGATDQGVWLNLSDGFMGGGRKHWDGSGGTNGAVEHYQETNQQYPLVVKLGTIHVDTNTKTVQADCYSYAPDEDGPVKIPNLGELLQKRGIDVAAM